MDEKQRVVAIYYDPEVPLKARHYTGLVYVLEDGTQLLPCSMEPYSPFAVIEPEEPKVVASDGQCLFHRCIHHRDVRQINQSDLGSECGACIKEYYEGILSMAVDRLGGLVEGAPTSRHNFLQRIDQLVTKEASR